MHNDSVVNLKNFDAEQTRALITSLGSLYTKVYAEPPYNEGESEGRQFFQRLDEQLHEPVFLLTTAYIDEALAGYIFGFLLTPDSALWDSLFGSSDCDQLPAEKQTSIVYVSELLVRATLRTRGIGRMLHDEFLAQRTEGRAALFAHPEAVAAQAAYSRWGWKKVGHGYPFPNGPIYDTLILDLNR